MKQFYLLNSNFKYSFLFFILLFSISSCEKEPEFKADFSFEFIDDNHLKYKNASVGDYYLLVWDFGNEQTEKTGNENAEFEIYYPEAGEYTVSLKILKESGESNTVEKKVTITNNDLLLSFTATPDATKPNYVLLTNNTTGSYDSFKWIYDGKEVTDENNHLAYFPFAGSYEIELQIQKEGYSISKKENINILTTDPDYSSNLTLTWSEEFNGNTINTDVWNYDLGFGDWGWGNNELQEYTQTNGTVTNGKLIITAKKVNDNTAQGSYTSTRINTKGKKEFKYGRIEIRAKLPAGRGIWPAIWMLGGNLSTAGWPACGEMDIMEYVGYEPDIIHSTVHTNSGSGANGSGSSKELTTCEEEFHIYGLDWTQEKLVFYTDNPENVTHTYAPANKTADNWPFDQTCFFILNIAVGGTWGGAQGVDNSIFPQTMEVDYVRVYQ